MDKNAVFSVEGDRPAVDAGRPGSLLRRLPRLARAFNQDWIWKPHCEPELEKPLRTIPSVATPAFVTPDGENSTLSPGSGEADSNRTMSSDATSVFVPPEVTRLEHVHIVRDLIPEVKKSSSICRWKLLILKKLQFWNNWGRKKILQDSKNAIRIEKEKNDIVETPSTSTIPFTATLAFVTTDDEISTLPPGPGGAACTSTIPSVSTPTIVSPEVPKLSPICRWRLAYLRENHLWNNWKRNKNFQVSENAIHIENERDDIIDVLFLEDTLIVVWRRHNIEILDVSEKSYVLKAKTSANFTTKVHNRCYVIGATMLLVDMVRSVEVYNVDLSKKLISFQHSIILADYGYLAEYRYVPDKRLVKGHLYLLADDERTMMIVFDLNTGELWQKDPYPVMVGGDEQIKVHEMASGSTSEFVAITFSVRNIHSGEKKVSIFVFSLEHLGFVPDFVIDIPPAPVYEPWVGLPTTALHRHWIAYIASKSLFIHNVQTKKEILCLKGNEYSELHVWNNCFLFKERKEGRVVSKVSLLLHGKSHEKTSLKKYSPEQRTSTTIFEYPGDDVYIGKIINQKSLIVFCYGKRYLFKQSGETMMKLKLEDIFGEYASSRLLHCRTEVNQSFTRGIFHDFNDDYYVQYLW